MLPVIDAGRQGGSDAYDERQAMLRLMPNVSGKRALCLHCGDGDVCVDLIENGAHVVGIDTFPAAIEQARRRLPDARFLVADVESPDLANEGPFDLVYTRLTTHPSDPQHLFPALHQLLAPGGHLLFSATHPSTPPTGAAPEDDPNDGHRLLAPVTYYKALNAAGFTDVVEMLDAPRTTDHQRAPAPASPVRPPYRGIFLATCRRTS